MVRSSSEVVRELECGFLPARTAFSVDIEDHFFYFMPNEGLFTGFKKSIEEFGEISFLNASGAGTESFLELLRFYLNSTVISHVESFYVQKTGICIGNAVGPVLRDIDLSFFDRRLQRLCDQRALRVFRYGG